MSSYRLAMLLLYYFARFCAIFIFQTTPTEIREGDEFKAVLSSHHIAPFVFAMTTDEHVVDVLQGYTDESPWLSAALKGNCT